MGADDFAVLEEAGISVWPTPIAAVFYIVVDGQRSPIELGKIIRSGGSVRRYGREMGALREIRSAGVGSHVSVSIIVRGMHRCPRDRVTELIGSNPTRDVEALTDDDWKSNNQRKNVQTQGLGEACIVVAQVQEMWAK